ncbi:hypothetical protein BKA69DRAFT_1034922 [Paraphysoderma sedebokerense]|nr:hypothetical protein BKA69DRAFT_1034922 [Paraphysoderma sedebokerense]
MAQPRSVAVLGGGISGLSSAYYLSTRLPNAEITLIEGSRRLGGWIHSEQVDGVTVEKGPRTIRPKGVASCAMVDLLSRLNLSSSIVSVPSYSPSAKNRYIIYNRNIHKVPTTISEFISNTVNKDSPFFGVLTDILSEPFRSRMSSPVNDESIHSFMKRRFGERLSNNVVSGVIHGIWAGDVRKLSINSTLSVLPPLESKYGSVLAGMVMSALRRKKSDKQLDEERRLSALLERKETAELWNSLKGSSVYTLQGGLEAIVKRLESELRSKTNVKFMMGNQCNKLEIENGKVKLQIQNQKESIVADHVVSSLSTQALSALVQPASPNLSSLLSAIPYVTVAVTNLVFPRASLPLHSLALSNGFGALAPLNRTNDTDPLLLGIIFDSTAGMSRGRHEDQVRKYTVMMGGHLFGSLGISQNDLNSEKYRDEIKNRAIQIVKKYVEIPDFVEPAYVNTVMQNSCIPQFEVGYGERMDKIRSCLDDEFKGLVSVTGSWVNGVGVNDCVKTSLDVCDKLAGNVK